MVVDPVVRRAQLHSQKMSLKIDRHDKKERSKERSRSRDGMMVNDESAITFDTQVQ